MTQRLSWFSNSESLDLHRCYVETWKPIGHRLTTQQSRAQFQPPPPSICGYRSPIVTATMQVAEEIGLTLLTGRVLETRTEVSLKGLAHADLAKEKLFVVVLHEYLLFYVRFFCGIHFCICPFEIRQFKTNCDGLKIDWGSPHGCNYLWNAYYVITFCCFTQVFLDSAYKQLTMALSQAAICSGVIICRVT